MRRLVEESMLVLIIVSTIISCSAEDGMSYNYIIMQPDDFEFYEPWTPPPHIRNNAVFQFPGEGLPNLERLRLDGLQMKRAYTASAMCGTSRYSTITGRYPSRSSYGRNRNAEQGVSNVVIPSTKLEDVNEVPDGDDCSSHNLAALMKANGYKTGMIGKWHLWRTTRLTYTYTGLRDQIQSCGFDFAEGLYADNLGSAWTRDGPEFSHNMEWITEHAISFIKDASENDEPFFLYFNPTAPHNSGNVYQALTTYSCTDTPEGTLTSEPVVPEMTEGVGCDAYRQSVIDRAGGTTETKALGAIWVDDSVGAILRTLEDMGQLENTFFLFQMDHGQEAKSTLYEPGNRLAQFVHFPAKFSQQSFDGIVGTIDIGPTILEYAGIGENSIGYYPMDGQSWASALTSPNVSAYFESDRCLFSEMDQDRSVVCGQCEKMIKVLNTFSGGTATFGMRRGLAVGDELLFNLCDENGEYETSINKEVSAITDPILANRLTDLLTCHTDRTSPNVVPNYTITCGPQLEIFSETNAPSSAPTDAPSSNSTFAPSVAPTFASDFCFSGVTTVDSLERGTIKMSDLRINEKVRTEGGRYEKIHSFLHRNVDRVGEFLQLMPSGLEISPDHLVFVEGRGPIPASQVTVGDKMVGGETVAAIELVSRRGVFAPLTSSGTISVNGVVASNFVTFQDSKMFMIGSWETPFSYHWLCLSFQRPRQLWCTLSGGCQDELYDEDGLSVWAVVPLRVLRHLLSSNPVILGAVFIPFLICMVVLSHPLTLFGAILIGALLRSRIGVKWRMNLKLGAPKAARW